MGQINPRWNRRREQLTGNKTKKRIKFGIFLKVLSPNQSRRNHGIIVGGIGFTTKGGFLVAPVMIGPAILPPFTEEMNSFFCFVAWNL